MFLYHQWLSLPISTRIKIANQFGIAKRGSTEVFDNQIKSDGYLVKEVEEALNIDAIQKYLGVSETNMTTLWTWLVDKIEGRELTKVDTAIPTLKIPEDKTGENILINPKKKSGRPKKNG